MNKFDKILSDKLTNYPSRVDDKVWANIEQELFPAKKPTVIPYKLLGLLAFIFASSSLWFMFGSKSQQAISYSTKESSASVLANEENISDQKNDELEIKEDQTPKLSAQSRKQKGSIEVQEFTSINSRKSLINSDLNKTNKSKNVSPQVYPSSQVKSTKSVPNSYGSTIAQSSSSIHSNRGQDQSPSSTATSSNLGSNNEAKVSSLELILNTSKAESQNSNIKSSNYLPKDIISISLLEHKVAKLESTIYAINPTIDIIKKKRKPMFSVDLMAGVDLPMRSLMAAEVDATSQVITRDNTEVNYISWASAVRFSFHPSRKVALRTGLFMNQYNIKFNYTDLNATQEEILVQDQDTTVYVVQGQREVQHLNHYRSYSIPFQIGITKSKGPFHISINPGVLFDIHSQVTGRVVDQSNRVFDIDEDDESYKRNFGMSFFGSVGLGYSLSSKMDFYFEPNIRYNMSNINASDVSIEERFTSFGILSGLRYHF